jgi:elongation factor P--(R)-beta-lysine ligase
LVNAEAQDATTQMSQMTQTSARGATSAWWTPERHADVRPFLAARAAVTRALRGWFDEQGFAEVETGILQVSPGNEIHLHAPRTEIISPDGTRSVRYLRTSPEFACKKLLAAGEARIFEFARVFRDRERGDLHLPEFTMLEWYRADVTYDAVMADSIVLIAHAAQATGIGQFSFRGKVVDPFAEPELLTVAVAFERFAGVDLFGTIADGKGDRDALAAVAAQRVRISDDDTWSDIFSKLLVEHVEPKLGQGRLTILFEYPVPEAALARAKPSDLRVAERFEVYACGVELANGFGELTDSGEQRLRFTEAMREKQRRYGERYPIDEEFLEAVAQMPQASGVALGFDRLVMLASGALKIDQVVWTPPAAAL